MTVAARSNVHRSMAFTVGVDTRLASIRTSIAVGALSASFTHVMRRLPITTPATAGACARRASSSDEM